MVYFFDKIIKNILSNYIPHKVVTCDDGDPPWINKTIKRLIQQKNDAHKCYIKNNKKGTCLRNLEFYKHN